LSKVCSADKSGGVDIYAGFRQVNSTIQMDMEFQNINCPMPVGNIAIQLNKNSFGLSPATQQIACDPPIQQGQSGKSSVNLIVTPNMLAPVQAGQPASPQIQVAIKNMGTGSVFYFAANFSFEALFGLNAAIERTDFIETWKTIDDRKELYGTVSDLPSSSTTIEKVRTKFAKHNIAFIARRPVPNAEGQEVAYFSMKTVTDMVFLAELKFKDGLNACKICIKTESISYGVLAKLAIENLLRN